MGGRLRQDPNVYSVTLLYVLYPSTLLSTRDSWTHVRLSPYIYTTPGLSPTTAGPPAAKR